MKPIASVQKTFSMDRRKFLTTIGLGASALTLSSFDGMTAETSSNSKRMNILWITADDLDSSMMGWMGGKHNLTPNIDEFSRTSYSFRHLHGAAPICQPSREAMMTGRLPHHSGALGFDPVNPEVPTSVEILSKAGYFCAAMNKLGHMAPPKKFAWDWTDNVHTKAHGGEDSNVMGWRRNPPNCYEDTKTAIGIAKNAGKPFFINYNLSDPHRPFCGTSEDAADGSLQITPAVSVKDVEIPGALEDLPEIRKELVQYSTSVLRCDQCFGEVIRALKESGEMDHTIILFVADHGMPFPWAKTTLYQHGTHTPMLIRYPGLIEPHMDESHMVSNMDILPTVLELAGIQTPAMPEMDGLSLLPILQGKIDSSRDHVFTYVHSTSAGHAFPSRCVRTKDYAFIWNSWSDGKIAFKNESTNSLSYESMSNAAKTNSSIASRVSHFLHRTPFEFYSLKEDPSERKNEFGNPEFETHIHQFTEMLRKQMKDTRDPFLSKFESSLTVHA
jgi:N-sulfoglucosamine sulfohydrolase